MGNPALDYFYPTIASPGSIIDKFQESAEDLTGANIFEFSLPEFAKYDKKYALWKFVVNDAPLSAVVTPQGRRWFAEVDWLNLFGEGDSPSDAISNLSDHIEHFIEFYTAKPLDELTDHAIKTRDRFMSIVQNP